MADRPPISLLEACADRKLLAVDLWPAQAAVLRQLESGRYREAVIAWGRRSGKSLIAAAIAVHDAAFRDLRSYLRQGEQRFVVIVAASQPQAGVVLDMVRELLTASPLLASTIVAQTENDIAIRQPHTGARVVIRALPCSARTVRGLAASTVILDELAHWISDTEGPAVADRVYRAISPSVAQFAEHGRLLSISTPWGDANSGNLFARLYQRAASGDHVDMLAANAPTWLVNPTLPQSFFDTERAKDPDAFAGEYAAEFSASGGAYLSRQLVERAVDGDHELPPGAVIAPVAGLDLAFSRDASALVIIGRDRMPSIRETPTANSLSLSDLQGNTSPLPEPSEGLRTAPRASATFRVAACRRWQPSRDNPLRFSAVIAEAAAVCHAYRVRRVVIDQFSSAAALQELRRHGLQPVLFNMSAGSKAQAYLQLKQRLSDGTLVLYRDDQLLRELSRLTVHYTSGGTVSIRSPRTSAGHGDLASALALAVTGLRQPGKARTSSPVGRRVNTDKDLEKLALDIGIPHTDQRRPRRQLGRVYKPRTDRDR
jgi:phage terminase large subunit-like protein